MAKLQADVSALPDPTAQLEDLSLKAVQFLAADGRLDKKLVAAVGEMDALKINLQHLDHEFKHAGYKHTHTIRVGHEVGFLLVFNAHAGFN